MARLAALRLFQAAMKPDELLLAVGAGPHLLPLYQALKWRLQPVAGTYYSVARMSALLELASEGEGDRPAWTRLVPLADPAFRLSQFAGCALHRSPRVVVADMTAFDAEADRLIDELSPLQGVTTYRSAATLNWKFRDRLAGKHFLLAARAAGGVLRGYAAVKLMRRGGVRWGEITDLLAHPAESHVFQTLLSVAVQRCGAFDADFLRLRCSHPSQTALLRPPFWIRRNRPVIDDLLYFTRDQELAGELARTPWHLTSVVSDRTDHGRDEWDQ